MRAQQVLEPLLKSPPPQNRFAANPPGKQHVVGSTLGLVAYAGKAFLKKGALPWDNTKLTIACAPQRSRSTWSIRSLLALSSTSIALILARQT